MTFDFRNKIFRLINTSDLKGNVNFETIVYCQQTDDIVPFYYEGGGVLNGVGLGILNHNILSNRSIYLTWGDAILEERSQITLEQLTDGRIRGMVKWEWADGTKNGVLVMEEVTEDLHLQTEPKVAGQNIMSTLHNFNGKHFRIMSNEGVNPTITNETKGIFWQVDNVIHSDYYGGGVRYGKMIGVIDGDRIHIRHIQINNVNELQSGEFTSQIIVTPEGVIRLINQWEWSDGTGRGTSVLEFFEPNPVDSPPPEQ